MVSKAQISAEFFMLVGLAFLIAIAFEIASLDQLKDFRIQKEEEAIRDVALKVQKELFIAANVEDGYVRTFELPDRLDNTINYSLTILNSTLFVQSKNSFYTVSIPKVVGNLSRGINGINKTGGVLYLNNIKLFAFANFNICQNAQSGGLCDGLDVAYGEGYKAACCSEHSLCC